LQFYFLFATSLLGLGLHELNSFSCAVLGSTTLDRNRIHANSSSNPNPKAQLCLRSDEMTSFFDQG